MKIERPFVTWAGQEIEKCLQRNDHKQPWETADILDLRDKIKEEYYETIEAIDELHTPNGVKHLQHELADLAAIAMMLSARVDKDMSLFKRGREQ